MDKKFESSYKNQYGETWIFEYDYGSETGVVRGSDVDWYEYAVVNGEADDLVMHDEEKAWLMAAWHEAISLRQG